MKRILLLVASFVFISTSCSVTKYVTTGQYRLSTIDAPNVDNFSANNSTTYTDEVLSITADIERDYIALKVVNNASSSLKVNWDDGAYIDASGNAHRIIHTGTKLVDKEKAQVASVIPKGSQLLDTVCPSDYVDYSSVSGWTYTPLVYGGVEFDTEADAFANLETAKPIKLLLPIEYEGTIREYTFTFVGYDFGVDAVKTMDHQKTLWTVYGVTMGACLISIAVALM